MTLTPRRGPRRRRTRAACASGGAGRQAGHPSAKGDLPADLRRELQPNGPVEVFLCRRIAEALSGYDGAAPSNLLFGDPFAKKQSEVLSDLYQALAELRALQDRRNFGTGAAADRNA